MDDTTSPSVSVVHGEDGEEYGINSARPARIGYVILVAGEGEAHKAKKLLQAIYHPRNFYLVHLDRKTGDDAREDLEAYMENWDNARMLEPALSVTYASVTQLLTSIFAISKLLQWSDEWDFFINLSASDFPLLPQDEIMWLLGQHVGARMNFMCGGPVKEGDESYVRLTAVAEDESLHREDPMPKVGLRHVDSSRRPPSESMFTVYKGEYWVILHRSFCQYGHDTPDNIARSLQEVSPTMNRLPLLTRVGLFDECMSHQVLACLRIYFGSFWDPTESYFQTLVCHPMAPDFPTHPDCMRYVDWRRPARQHPNLIIDATEAQQSGALFARKFDLEKSRQAYDAVEEAFANRDPERVRRALERISAASATVGREVFCNPP